MADVLSDWEITQYGLAAERRLRSGIELESSPCMIRRMLRSDAGNRRSRSASVFCASLLALLPACSYTAPGIDPTTVAERSPASFAAAVGYFAGRSSVPVRVDPRPLRPEARLSSVRQSDLITSEAEIIRIRTRVVESGGWSLANAVEDWGCVLSQGVPPARPPQSAEADSLRLHREACRQRGQFESLIFGLPQPASDTAHGARWRIRAMRMLPSGYEVVDLFLEQRPRGEWQVVDAQVRSGVFS